MRNKTVEILIAPKYIDLDDFFISLYPGDKLNFGSVHISKEAHRFHKYRKTYYGTPLMDMYFASYVRLHAVIPQAGQVSEIVPFTVYIK